MDTRYEILPLGAGEADALKADPPLTITITCSPRHGIDHSMDVAERLRDHGHEVCVHASARMFRDEPHVDGVLQRMSACGVDDLFLIGGDATDAAGPYSSAVELLPLIDAHVLRPKRIGIAGYPEGHPSIDDATLDEALEAKAGAADYLVSQLCFDRAALVEWIGHIRDRGIALPLWVGIPGAVDRKRLLEVSMKVGVGASLRFVRKQRGLRRLFGRPDQAATELDRAVVPLVGDSDLGVEGIHYYTFDRVTETLEREQADVGHEVARHG